eukprot:15379938-Heterocapsa_arctica.AAC.1
MVDIALKLFAPPSPFPHAPPFKRTLAFLATKLSKILQSAAVKTKLMSPENKVEVRTLLKTSLLNRS